MTRGTKLTNATGSAPEDMHGQSPRVLQGKNTDRATPAVIARLSSVKDDRRPSRPKLSAYAGLGLGEANTMPPAALVRYANARK